MNFLAVTNAYWEMTMVVERGPEPMGEKGRGYGLARWYQIASSSGGFVGVPMSVSWPILAEAILAGS